MKKILFLIAVFLFSPFLEVLGQTGFREGFIITSKGDTLLGQLDNRLATLNYKSCRFKNEGGIKEYFPSQLIGFRFKDDKFFKSHIVGDSFVEVLVTGELSLFKQGEAFYLQKAGGEVFKLKTNEEIINGDKGARLKEKSKWKGIAAFLTADCPESSQEIEKLRFSDRSLTLFVIRYNECVGKEFIDFKEKKEWSKLSIGLATGMVNSSIKINEIYTRRAVEEVYNVNDPFIGAALHVASPRISERIILQLEPYYVPTNVSTLVFYKGVGGGEYHDVLINIHSLSIPFSLRYHLVDRKYNLFLQGGASFEFNIKRGTNLRSERISGSSVFTSETSIFPVDNIQSGLLGGIGVQRDFNKFEGVVSVKYQASSILESFHIKAAHVDSLSLYLIILKK